MPCLIPQQVCVLRPLHIPTVPSGVQDTARNLQVQGSTGGKPLGVSFGAALLPTRLQWQALGGGTVLAHRPCPGNAREPGKTQDMLVISGQQGYCVWRGHVHMSTTGMRGREVTSRQVAYHPRLSRPCLASPPASICPQRLLNSHHEEPNHGSQRPTDLPPSHLQFTVQEETGNRKKEKTLDRNLATCQGPREQYSCRPLLSASWASLLSCPHPPPHATGSFHTPLPSLLPAICCQLLELIP